MKKLFAIILALAMTFALSATALANPPEEDPPAQEPSPGTIVITLTSLPSEGTGVIEVNNREFKVTAPGGTVQTLTTGTEGKITINDAAVGEHKIEPVEVTGYNIICTSNNVPAVITDGNTVNVEYVIQKTDAQPPVNGTITITTPVPGATYCIYEMFKVVSYSGSGNDASVQYQVDADWSSFFTDGNPGHDYITVDGNGTPTWVNTSHDAATVQTFVQAALAWAKADPDGEATAPRIQPNECKTVPTTPVPANPIVFGPLEQGYWLVDSSAGALCAINTMHPNADIGEKNDIPTPDKSIVSPGDNDYSVGDFIHFQAVIKGLGNTVTLKYNDTMSVGLEFVNDTAHPLAVNLSTTTGTPPNETTTTSPVAATNYTVKTGTDAAPYTFTVTFTPEFVATLKTNNTITIDYWAELTDAAITTDKPIQNAASVSFGDNGDIITEDPEPVIVHTWGFNIYKYTGDALPGTALSGAEFVLKNSDGKYATWTLTSGVYHFNGWVDGSSATPPYPDTAILKSGADGKIALAGIDSGTYTLQEVKAPEGGYNLPADTFEVKIDSSGVVTFKNNNDTDPSFGATTEKTVNIQNNKGSGLPSVGGIGTTIFYIIGGLLMVGAVVLLVVRKKMSVTE